MSSDQGNRNHTRQCMVVHAYYPLGETRVEREAHALIARGYEVDVICLRKEGEPAVDFQDRINIHRLPVKRHKRSGLAVQLFEYLVFFILAFVKLTALHLQRRYLIVQVHNLPDFLVFAALVPKVTGARVILDLHDLMPEFCAARFNSDVNSWLVRLVRWQEQLSCRFADHVITVTERWRERLVKRGLPAEKVTVVMLDADGSTDPAEISAFVGVLLAGADFAKGSRFLQGGDTADMPLYRRLGDWGFTVLVRLLFGGRYSDLCYGYNAFWSRVLAQLNLARISDTDGTWDA
jgi:glycosyltransferase involved in cell wall biosynthesis